MIDCNDIHFNQDAHVTWHKKWAEKNAEVRTQLGKGDTQ
jgi:hypothetical protein